MARTNTINGLIGGAVLGVVLAFAAPGKAQDFSGLTCQELWHQRNAIYAQHGHCFKTARGIAVFGKNCFPPFGQLTQRAQSTVNTIISWERRKGCPR